MEQLLNALAAHRENREYQDNYTTVARKESPEILDWCQDDENYNVIMYNIHYTQFKYMELEPVPKIDTGDEKMPLFAEHWFMQSHEHRRLGLILVLAYFQACVQKNDAVGVPKADVLYGMKCNQATATRIVKAGIDAGIIGQTINKEKRSEKVLYATEVMLHTYTNKTYRFFHDQNMKDTLEYSFKIREQIKKNFGQQVPKEKRMKIMSNWLKNKGQKFLNGGVLR